MTAMNKTLVIVGVATMFQAAGQMLLTTLALLQHFCVIDFLREFPILIFIKVLYFYNPSTCDTRINIGQAIDGMADQAFILLTREPFTATRTFIINAVNLGISVLWLITSVGLMNGGGKNSQSKPIRWPWIFVTVAVCGMDLVATVTYANDSFHTRTLSDIMEFIGGTASGTGSIEVNTAWCSWIMVIVYSRFVVLFFVNLFLIVLVVVIGGKKRLFENTSVQVEAPKMTDETTTTSLKDVDEESLQSELPPRIPRPGLSHSFRRMKARLFNRTPAPIHKPRVDSCPNSLDASPEVIPRAGLSQSFRRMKARLFNRTQAPVHEPRVDSSPNSSDASPEMSPRTQHIDIVDKKRSVNFPVNLLSLPHRLENMIAEQQKRLDKAVIDTSGRLSPPRVSQSMPQLASTSTQDARGFSIKGSDLLVHASLGSGDIEIFGSRLTVLKSHSTGADYEEKIHIEKRRGTAAELQGQLPWAYIPASAHRMRDQLPPDEDLPPVPLPDYTAIPSFRKASVHRAASSLSSLTRKRPPLTSSDVLY